MDSNLNKSFHALLNDLPLDASDKKAVRIAIIWEVSNYEISSWTQLDDTQAIQAIKFLEKQIKRLKK